jgi:hypothetical protein
LDVRDLCLQINLSVGLQVGFQAGTVVRERIVDSMAGLFIMMPHLGSFGLRIKYLLTPVRLSWARNNSSSGYTTLLVSSLINSPALLLWNWLPSRRRTTVTSYVHMCGGVRRTCTRNKNEMTS